MGNAAGMGSMSRHIATRGCSHKEDQQPRRVMMTESVDEATRDRLTRLERIVAGGDAWALGCSRRSP